MAGGYEREIRQISFGSKVFGFRTADHGRRVATLWPTYRAFGQAKKTNANNTVMTTRAIRRASRCLIVTGQS
jgi:hypothetical protein